eukprot:2082732-Rhodomonas_salina.2
MRKQVMRGVSLCWARRWWNGHRMLRLTIPNLPRRRSCWNLRSESRWKPAAAAAAKAADSCALPQDFSLLIAQLPNSRSLIVQHPAQQAQRKLQVRRKLRL